MEHSIAGFKAREDDALDAEMVDFKPRRIVQEQRREALTLDGAPRPPRQDQDETAQYKDEVHVIRMCVLNGPPRANGREIGGSLGRMIDKKTTGTAGIASSTKAYEPNLGSDHYRHAYKCWLTIPGEEREYLAAMFVGIDSPEDGGADKIARTVRGHLQHGKVSEAEAALPAFATAFSGDGLTMDKATNANTLLAIRLGWWRADAAHLHEWPDARAVKRVIAEGRSKLKMALARVELDASGESLHHNGARNGCKPLLIPAPSMKEVMRQRADVQTVAACLGRGPMDERGHGECLVDSRSVDVSVADKCPACERWRA